MNSFDIPLREIRATAFDIRKLLIKMGFASSKNEAARLISQKSVEIVERTGHEDYRRIAGLTEYLLAHSRETRTIVRCGKKWKEVNWKCE
jgi:tyrosyl-tRNA synthetase